MSILENIVKEFQIKKKEKGKTIKKINYTEMNKYLKEHFSEPETLRLIKMIKVGEKMASGRSLADACRQAPVSYSTVRDWIAKANKAIEFCDANDISHKEHQDFMYVQFQLFLEEAKQEFKYKLVDGMLDQGHDEWLEDEEGNKIQLLKRGDWKALDRVGKIIENDTFNDKVEIENKGSVMQQQTGIILVPTVDASTLNLEDMSDITKASQAFLTNKVEEDGLNDN